LKRREKQNSLIGSGQNSEQSSEQEKGLMIKINEVSMGGSFYQIAKNEVKRKLFSILSNS